MEILVILLASILSLLIGYIAYTLVLFSWKNIMFSGPSEEELEGLGDEEFIEYIDEYLQSGVGKLGNLQKRKLGIKMPESILGGFILISRFFK